MVLQANVSYMEIRSAYILNIVETFECCVPWSEYFFQKQLDCEEIYELSTRFRFFNFHQSDCAACSQPAKRNPSFVIHGNVNPEVPVMLCYFRPDGKFLEVYETRITGKA